MRLAQEISIEQRSDLRQRLMMARLRIQVMDKLGAYRQGRMDMVEELIDQGLDIEIERAAEIYTIDGDKLN